jgi:hypothetical protein
MGAKEYLSVNCTWIRVLNYDWTKGRQVCEDWKRSWTKMLFVTPILFKLYSEYLTKEALEAFGDFKIGGLVIRTVKYVDDLLLLTKEETVPQA